MTTDIAAQIEEWLIREIDDKGRHAGLRVAIQRLLELSGDDRLNVWTWFCDGCGQLLASGTSCHCWNDD